MKALINQQETFMKQTFFAFAILALAGAASAQTYVAPHVRSNGTYVQGHIRSAPNSTLSDNYSTSGNVNPHTGQSGTLSPYSPVPNPWAR